MRGTRSPTTSTDWRGATSTEERVTPRLLFEPLDPELRTLPARRRLFRANRSMRDVEPSVNLWVKTLDNEDVVTTEGEV